jgi:hypothetical protein
VAVPCVLTDRSITIAFHHNRRTERNDVQSPLNCLEISRSEERA